MVASTHYIGDNEAVLATKKESHFLARRMNIPRVHSEKIEAKNRENMDETTGEFRARATAVVVDVSCAFRSKPFISRFSLIRCFSVCIQFY